MTGNTINLGRYERPIRWSAKPSSTHFKTIYIMKNLFLITLSLTLFLGQAFAQKTLSPSANQYTGSLNYTVKKILNEAGYELPEAQMESPVKQSVQTRFNEFQLDSTVTFYNYDPSGQVDSTPLFRTVYTYHSSDLRTEVESVFENGTWVPLNRTTIASDELGRIVDAFSAFYDPLVQDWVLDSKVEIYPHGSSFELVDSVFVLGWSPDVNDWVRLMSIWNTYENQDQLTVSLTLIDIFGQPLHFMDIYSYDISGDNTLIESYLVEGGFEYFAGKRDLLYDEHHLINEIAYASDGEGGFEKQYQKSYYYTGNWQLESEATFNWDLDSNDWQVIEAIFYEYDAMGRLAAKESTYIIPGSEAEHQLITYEYVEGEYLALETNYTYDFNAENFVLSDRTYFYYKGGLSPVPNEPVVPKSLALSPNPTIGVANIKLDAAASVKVFDFTGRLVQGFSAMPGQVTIDLAMLPAGIYEVRAQTGKEIYAGKIVKQ